MKTPTRHFNLSFMKQIILFFLLIVLSTITSAQKSDLRIGQWKSHLPYHSGKWITQSETTIYYASPFALFTIEKEDFAVDFLSKVEGLSDVGINKIKYNQATNVLVVIYNNSNIDLIKPEGIINLNDIPKNTSIVGDRTVYDILFEGNGALLSTGFGIVKLNLEREEFEFTTFTGVPVFGLALYDNNFYAATEEGIYLTENNPANNLADFNNWRLLDVADGFPAEYSSNAVAAHHNSLYLDINGSLFRLDDGVLSELRTEVGFSVRYLSVGEEHLITGFSCNGDCRGKVLFFKNDNSFLTAKSKCVDRPFYAIEEQNGRIWFADQFRGIRFSEQAGDGCNPLDFNSPFSHNSSEIVLANDKIYIASGGIASNLTALNRVDGIFIKEDNNWRVLNRSNVPIFLEEKIDRDFYRMAVHPIDGTIIYGYLLGWFD